jgi:ribonuclease T1
MRRWVIFGGIAAAFLCAVMAPATARPPQACGAAIQVPAAHSRVLTPFVRNLGIRNIRATVGVLHDVWRTGELPSCYLTKRRARMRGWRPGHNLWRSAPGYAIGGDRFGNRERRLPLGQRYAEADLDFTGGRRGAKRLVFVRDSKGRWSQWITVDHYRSFTKVPNISAESPR